MICTDAPRTSTPVDEGKTNTAHIDEPGISPITKDCHNEIVTKPEKIEMPGVSPITKHHKSTKTQNSKMEIRQGKDISNKETSRNTSKSISMKTKKKHDKNKAINKENSRNTSKSSPSKTKKKHDSSKNTSLPLQASMCIEDDSDKESIPDNITPEVIPHIKVETYNY
ncbi:hypothetical protein AC249_AIPGENE23098 [Exaiptasia diaphana]|nr:hypothetical protein AC249_AIPGENE23098 [Exaiptasia diaphana]